MSLVGVIDRLKTGTYTVTRTAAGAYTAGRYAAGSTSTLTITASVQPVSGRELEVVAEGQHADEVRVVYTATALLTRTPTTEPDRITLGGEPWEVFRVEPWEAFGGGTSGTHWRAYVSRRRVP